ncbi:CDP-glycerol glycerophosphotransferase family protein [Nocardioides iriomotensis]|uniref:CDP-glycerol glycerophosphotransferase family protein n=1 Tax=Nocardioides iriomotensis TaxID=715784 RepID=A0A4Q5J9A6_9ACTN|nr:CDP-glycerol glycerophosphotransferase family protein [Nocardioides iriomotensis]
MGSVSDVRRWAGRLRRRVRASTEQLGDRVRGPASGPRVSAIAVVHGGTASTGHVDACVASVLGTGHRAVEVLLAPTDPAAERAVAASGHLGDRRVRVLPLGPAGLDAAVAAADGEYLTFVDSADELAAGSLPRLVASLEASGSDVALGPVAAVRGGRTTPPTWADTLYAGHLTGQQVGSCPDGLVGAALTGALHRTSSWHASGASVADWGARAVAAARVLLTSTFDVVPGTAYLRHDRTASLPVDEQPRFRPSLVAIEVGALRQVAALVADTDSAVYRRWLVLTLTHVVPPLLVDAVGGGSRSLEVLGPFVRDLVGDTGPGALAEIPVTARMLARASQGSLHDVALVQDLVADNPHGLPTERSAEGAQVVVLPAGLAIPVPDAVRRIESVDRVLRTVVGTIRRDDLGGLTVNGAAFVEYGERATVPTVTLAGPDGRHVPMLVEPRHDPDVNLWAQRAWEDRAGSGFTARLDPGTEPPSPSGRWRVDVHLGRRAGSHDVALADPADGPPTRLTGATLQDGPRPVLVLDGSGPAPARVLLDGGKGGSPAADVETSGRSWVARVPLVTRLFGCEVLLPAGRYAVELRDAAGTPVAARWHGATTHGDLVGDRLRLVPGDGPTGPVVSVAAPLRHDERSAYDQQRLQTHVYAAPPEPTYDGTVVLETFRGRSVGDNPGAIGREILARGLDLELAWVVDDPSVAVPEGTRALPRRSERWYDALGRARAYVGNAGAPYWFTKKTGQVHLQTWHGTPLKRIGEDRGPGDFQTWRHRRRIALQAAGWDAMISPSPFCSEHFRSAFRFDGRFLEVGYPRNDVLLDATRGPQVRARVRAALGLSDTDRVVLYAPTWREYVGVRDAKPLYLDAEALVRDVPDAVVLLRGHYNATHQADVFRGESRIHDVTRYPDIADLYLAADVLVTDYSSVMFDFALTDKPQVLLVPDLDQYRDVERGFYVELEDVAPGPLVATTDEVAAALAAEDVHGDRRAAFRDQFCPWDDGRAAARTVDWLLSQI